MKAHLLLVLAAAGCGTYRANRAALAPHATPQLHSGHPVDGVAEVSAGLSSVAHATDLGVGDPEAGVEVPGTQLHGDARLRLGEAFALGLVYENGLDETARRPREDQPPVDEGNVEGYGLTADVSIATRDPRLRIGLGFDLIIWSVPYVEYLTCVPGDPCFPGVTIMERGVDRTETFGLSFTPSYRMGALTWFGGLTTRQHPTIQQKGTETDPLLEGEGDVQSGPFNLLISAGLEAALLGGQLEATVVLYQDLTLDPVGYGPGLAVLVSVPLGRRARTTDATIEPPSSTVTTASDARTGTWTKWDSAILAPTKTSTSASPGWR